MFDPRKDVLIIDIGDKQRAWFASDTFTYGFPHRESLKILQPDSSYYYLNKGNASQAIISDRLMNNPAKFNIKKLRKFVETNARKLDPSKTADKELIDKAVVNYKQFLDDNPIHRDKHDTVLYGSETIGIRRSLDWKEYYQRHIAEHTSSHYLDNKSKSRFTNERSRMSLV
ncbi:MAG: hypothetical protein MK137_06210 [Rickettsiales bacterium]|nr:hypothetical protein [Rickettsiales bacterium]